MDIPPHLPPDWWDLADDVSGHGSQLEAQLRREVEPRHQLRGVAARAVAKHGPDDDVLFVLPDGRPAVVHLTWRQREEPDPRLPDTHVYESWQECLASLWDEWRLRNP